MKQWMWANIARIFAWVKNSKKTRHGLCPQGVLSYTGDKSINRILNSVWGGLRPTFKNIMSMLEGYSTCKASNQMRWRFLFSNIIKSRTITKHRTLCNHIDHSPMKLALTERHPSTGVNKKVKGSWLWKTDGRGNGISRGSEACNNKTHSVSLVKQSSVEYMRRETWAEKDLSPGSYRETLEVKSLRWHSWHNPIHFF